MAGIATHDQLVRPITATREDCGCVIVEDWPENVGFAADVLKLSDLATLEGDIITISASNAIGTYRVIRRGFTSADEEDVYVCLKVAVAGVGTPHVHPKSVEAQGR